MCGVWSEVGNCWTTQAISVECYLHGKSASERVFRDAVCFVGETETGREA